MRETYQNPIGLFGLETIWEEKFHAEEILFIVLLDILPAQFFL